MKKLGLLAMVLGIGGVIAGVSLTSGTAQAADPACHRTTFKTQLVHDACTGDGGSQAKAKAAMKQFLKENKSKKPGLDCNSCHSKLAPEYPLKDDALKTFQELGGKLLADSATTPPATPPKKP